MGDLLPFSLLRMRIVRNNALPIPAGDPTAFRHAPPALAALLARASVPPRQLGDPSPGEAALDLAVAAALRAPDHGWLKPWRFVFVTGEVRGMPGAVLAAS
jgi:hypothetical protein